MITANIQKINGEIGNGIKLIAVSKTKTAETILEAYHAGQKLFGENKVQEMVSKQSILPLDIEWHLIGHLQSNKVKYIASFVSMIHSVDSIKLLEEIDKEGKKNKRIINCLLQIYIASEETKFGLNKEEVFNILRNPVLKELKHIKICGLMGMASNTLDLTQIRNEFKNLHQLFTGIKTTFFSGDPNFKELSMGMSSDYTIAVEEGATLIRVGSLIFKDK
ncbi:MAG: YggS family pyridoxal phosphate-dependent enzyme [Bacteroidia bacterium]|nr:YggS family pyridoxal phosphate-dependent enzyme [Bacteroidia bacterium]